VVANPPLVTWVMPTWSQPDTISAIIPTPTDSRLVGPEVLASSRANPPLSET
jgi:hypothetical protein